MPELTVREARPEDAEKIAEIYRPYVEQTAISFELEAPDGAEISRRMAKTLKEYPYIVAELDGETVGYAYAGRFMPRPAYIYCIESTIYIRRDMRGKGIGRVLYSELERLLKAQNIRKIYACIAVPSERNSTFIDGASRDFHAHLGYRETGYFAECGWKFGRWYDMIWMEKVIGGDGAPGGFIPYPVVPDDVKNKK